jgi:hypothetical protein
MVMNPGSRNTDWPSALVAVAILALIGAVFVTAAIRYDPAELNDLLGYLAPILGVVSGAMVAFFFTRQATAAAVGAAQEANAATQNQLKKETDRAVALERQVGERNTALHIALDNVEPAKQAAVRNHAAIKPLLP